MNSQRFHSGLKLKAKLREVVGTGTGKQNLHETAGDARGQREGADSISLEEIAAEMVQRAYGLPSHAMAQEHMVEVGLEKGNLYEGVLLCFEALTWERLYFVEALRVLLEVEDAEGLRVVLGMLRSGANWCNARKLWMFGNIVQRVGKIAASAEEVTHVVDGQDSAVPVARWRIREAMIDLVEEIKDQAFKSTFLEPTKMFFRSCDDAVREDNVEMHGANTYLGVLFATLGVQMNRRPLLDDVVVGCADFLAEESPEPAAWAEEHFGRDWEGVAALRKLLGEKGHQQSEPGLFEVIHFLVSTCWSTSFIFEGRFVREVANAAVDPRGPRDKRLHLARYLEKFSSWSDTERDKTHGLYHTQVLQV
eukprot:4747857-Amphidinium_carterae.1